MNSCVFDVSLNVTLAICDIDFKVNESMVFKVDTKFFHII